MWMMNGESAFADSDKETYYAIGLELSHDHSHVQLPLTAEYIALHLMA